MRSLLIAAALVAVVAGCGSAEPESTKYVQTWSKAYGETTCADWRQDMTDEQQFVMAADMLLSVHRQTKPDAEIPSDRLVQKFMDAIDGSCVGQGEELGIKVSEVAAFLYTLANDLGPE